MAYVEQFALDADALEALRVICKEVDVAPGPGGSRITALGTIGRNAAGIVIGKSVVLAAVVALYPSSQLVAHRDPPIKGTRHHVPLSVNPGCWVFHAGTWQQLREGIGYSMDQTEEHGAVNWGPTVRTHCILDVA